MIDILEEIDESVLLTADVVLDDLDEHEAQSRASYLLEPADVIEENLCEMGIEPRQADRGIIENGYVPHRLQAVVHKELQKYRFFVLVCHRRFGKTVLAVNALCHAAVTHTTYMGKPGRFAYIAPLRSQARNVAWMYLKAFAAGVKGARKNESELWVEFPNGARVTLFGANLGQADNLRGIYLDGCVFDEPSQMDPEVWEEVVRPACSDHDAWVLFIGTPKGINLFSELYDQAEDDPEFGRASYPVTETFLDWLPESEIDSIQRGLSEARFRQEMMCDFGASSADTIISLDTISKAIKRNHKSTSFLKGMPKVVGIDPAWMGDDKTAIAFRWGTEMFPLAYFGKDEHDQIIGYLQNLRKTYAPDAWFCDQAYSEGIYAHCEEIGIPLNLVPFGSSPLDKTQYGNRVTEMYFLFDEWLNKGGKLPNDYILKGDLSSVTYEFRQKSFNNKTYDVRQRHEKKKIKEKINRSPDGGDACVLTTCELVMSKSSKHEEHTNEVQTSDGGYHPHNKMRRKNQRPKSPRR
jgi:hypothetical protein